MTDLSPEHMAGLLRLGEDQALPAWTDSAAWVGSASNEGMVSLLHAAMADRTDLPAEIRYTLTDAAREAMAYAMAFEAQSRRILKHLSTSATPSLLLKGAALAHWAYEKPHWRSCGDVDILLPSRAAADRLAEALESDGFECLAPSGGLVAYEMMCQKAMGADWSLEVDIHWRLSNSALHADRFSFDELMADSVAIPSLGPNARGLGPVHAMLHAAMHRASNIEIGVGDRLKWLYDFVVLEKHFGPDEWARLTALARERQLAGVTLSALEATSAMFGTVFPEDVLAALREAAKGEPLDAGRLDDWAYMQAQTMRALPGWGAKLRWLWQRVFPSRDYMTYLYGDRGGYAALMWERVKRAWGKWRG